MRHAGHKALVNNVWVDCIPASMRDTELRNRDQTFRDDYRASIAIINSSVSAEQGDRVTYQGAARRVLDTSVNGDGTQKVLHLGSEFGGA